MLEAFDVYEPGEFRAGTTAHGVAFPAMPRTVTTRSIKAAKSIAASSVLLRRGYREDLSVEVDRL
jgi:hypothetical protein